MREGQGQPKLLQFIHTFLHSFFFFVNKWSHSKQPLNGTCSTAAASVLAEAQSAVVFCLWQGELEGPSILLTS